RPMPVLAGTKHRLASTIQPLEDLRLGLAQVPRKNRNALGDIQQILSGEFLLRVGRGVAVWLNPEPPSHERRVRTKERVHVVGPPEIERSLRLVGALGVLELRR